ncbi:MAG TPA: entericidin A/B family lipoprotein [Burkholderiaceae bacterium]|nr:entericidin A/B family lipoprotein [Burkholderiaceae bacterium]
MARRIIGFLLLTATLGLTACNTVGGLGRDIEAGGNKLENAAERGKR